MGQKVSPHGLRVGVIKDWDSKWYANKKDYSKLLKEDYDIRTFVKKTLYTSGISRVYIDRAANDRVNVNIFTAKPGMIVGKGGESIKILKDTLTKMTGKNIQLDISEVVNPESDAQLVAENVALSLEKRIAFRRAMKQAIGRSMRAYGVEGIKIATAGRLGGAEMARNEGYSEGNVPLSTLRADIDYGFAEADTTYGKIGVKVWIYKGEVLPGPNGVELRRIEARKASDRRPPARGKGTRNTGSAGGRDNRGGKR
jgi:small subunit ribosomal protein S3